MNVVNTSCSLFNVVSIRLRKVLAGRIVSEVIRNGIANTVFIPVISQYLKSFQF